jgi:hypothetical protein
MLFKLDFYNILLKSTFFVSYFRKLGIRDSGMQILTYILFFLKLSLEQENWLLF